MSHENRTGGGDVTLAFLLGVVAGAAVALWFAPAAGRDIREFVAQKARDGQDKAAEFAREGWTKGREAFQQARDQAREQGTGKETA